MQQQLDSFFQLLQGDHLQAAEGREANIIECIMGVSRLLCGASQAIFKKHHGDVALERLEFQWIGKVLTGNRGVSNKIFLVSGFKFP